MEEVVGSIPTRSTIFYPPRINHFHNLPLCIARREIWSKASTAPSFTIRFFSMAGTARWRWICGERIGIFKDWCHRLSTTGAESPLVFLINFVMPFFGRRQAFVVVAVVSHICKLLFVDRPGQELIATAGIGLTHQLLFTARCQQDDGNVLGRLVLL
jgi:hypothetical protein